MTSSELYPYQEWDYARMKVCTVWKRLKEKPVEELPLPWLIYGAKLPDAILLPIAVVTEK